MLFSKLTCEEKEAMNYYRDTYAYNDDFKLPKTKPADLEYVLRFWNQEKQNLYSLLGNNLMVSKRVRIDKQQDIIEDEMYKFLCNSKFYSSFRNIILKNFNAADDLIALSSLFYCDTLIKNKYTCSTRKITFKDVDKTITLQNGSKPLRILSRIAEIYGLNEEFEEFRLEHSRILNDKKMFGDLVLSIHPLDYITMSDNDCGWTSCMSWQEAGCYRRGTVEMMNSPYVIVAYLKSEKDFSLSNNKFSKTSYMWSNKKWRELYIVDEKFITNIKSYPFQNTQLTHECINFIAELAKQNLGWEYAETIEKYKPYYMFSCNENEYRLCFETNTMYNDFNNASASFYTRIKKDLKPQTIRINYSGIDNCMHCGEESFFGNYDESEGNLVCFKCLQLYSCEECGEEGIEETMFKVDDCYLCEHCYTRYTEYAADDEDNKHLTTNLTRVFIIDDEEEASLDRYSFFRYPNNNFFYVFNNVPPQWFIKKYFNEEFSEYHWKRMWSYVYKHELNELGLKELLGEC